MYKIGVGFVLVGIVISCNTKEHKDPLVSLSRDITAKLNTVQGDFAVAFKDLRSGDTLFINADEVFHAASTMKIPVMIEMFKQADEGAFSLDDSILVKNEFQSIVDGSSYSLQMDDDSESVLYKKVGERLPIRYLMYEMITRSSNLATNLLVQLVDARKVTSTMRSLGATNIQVLRGVEDIKAFDKGLNNTTTARDLQVILESIANRQAISRSASKGMTNILLDQVFNEIIPAKLPKDVKVAHKTGAITGVQHDSAIVILPSGSKYVLVLLSKNLENASEGVQALSEVSRMVYQFVVGTDR